MTQAFSQEDYTIQLTPKAARVIHEAFAAEGVDQARALVRVGAHAGGCSGYKYDMDVTSVDEMTDADWQYESQGVRIVVDAACLTDILGSLEIDFRDGNVVEQGFTFRQLSQGAQCGCGESFTPVKELPNRGQPVRS